MESSGSIPSPETAFVVDTKTPALPATSTNPWRTSPDVGGNDLPKPLTPELYQQALDYARLAANTYTAKDWATASLGMAFFANIDHIRDFSDFETPKYHKEARKGNKIDWWFGKDQGLDYDVYKHESGDVVVAFRGTEPLSLEYWGEDLEQVLGSSEQYRAAIKKAKDIEAIIGKKNAESKEEVKLSFTGHSLGGGLATAAALATGCQAIVFDAAGISDITMSNKELGLERRNAKMVLNINVKGCFVADWNGKMDSTTLGTNMGTHLTRKLKRVGWLRLPLFFMGPAVAVSDVLLGTTCRQYGAQIWLENVNEKAKLVPKPLLKFALFSTAESVESWMKTYLCHAWHLYTYQLLHKNFVHD